MLLFRFGRGTGKNVAQFFGKTLLLTNE